MLTALRAFFLVPLCAFFLLVFSGIAYAAQDDGDGNLQCPSVPSVYVYVSGVKFGEKVGDKVNLYGKKCVDFENADKAAEGHCVGPKNCKADLCDGKPCALPKVDLKESQKTPQGGLPPASPAQTTPLNTNGSFLDQMMFDPTPLSNQKSTLAPSANSVADMLKQSDTQTGFLDKVRESIGNFFSPTPINPNQEAFKLQPRDENGVPIGSSDVGPQNTMTTPNSTFGETPEKERSVSVDEPPPCDSWIQCMREKISTLYEPTDLEEVKRRALEDNWNFGNMKKAGKESLNLGGTVPCAGIYICFATAQDGAKADFKNIARWIDNGRDTVAKLIDTLSPPFENNTNNMVRTIAAEMGVSPYEKLDFRNEEQMVKLFDAKTRLEWSTRASNVMDTAEITSAYRAVASPGSVSPNPPDIWSNTPVNDYSAFAYGGIPVLLSSGRTAHEFDDIQNPDSWIAQGTPHPVVAVASSPLLPADTEVTAEDVKGMIDAYPRTLTPSELADLARIAAREQTIPPELQTGEIYPAGTSIPEEPKKITIATEHEPQNQKISQEDVQKLVDAYPADTTPNQSYLSDVSGKMWDLGQSVKSSVTSGIASLFGSSNPDLQQTISTAQQPAQSIPVVGDEHDVLRQAAANTPEVKTTDVPVVSENKVWTPQSETATQLADAMRKNLEDQQKKVADTVATLSPEAADRGELACASTRIVNDTCTRFQTYQTAVLTEEAKLEKIANNYTAFLKWMQGEEPLRADLEKTLADMEKGQGVTSKSFDTVSTTLGTIASAQFTSPVNEKGEVDIDKLRARTLGLGVPGGPLVIGATAFLGSILTDDIKIAAERFAPDSWDFRGTPKETADCAAVGQDLCDVKGAAHAANALTVPLIANDLRRAFTTAPARLFDDIAGRAAPTIDDTARVVAEVPRPVVPLATETPTPVATNLPRAVPLEEVRPIASPPEVPVVETPRVWSSDSPMQKLADEFNEITGRTPKPEPVPAVLPEVPSAPTKLPPAATLDDLTTVVTGKTPSALEVQMQQVQDAAAILKREAVSPTPEPAATVPALPETPAAAPRGWGDFVPDLKDKWASVRDKVTNTVSDWTDSWLTRKTVETPPPLEGPFPRLVSSQDIPTTAKIPSTEPPTTIPQELPRQVAVGENIGPVPLEETSAFRRANMRDVNAEHPVEAPAAAPAPSKGTITIEPVKPADQNLTALQKAIAEDAALRERIAADAARPAPNTPPSWAHNPDGLPPPFPKGKMVEEWTRIDELIAQQKAKDLAAETRVVPQAPAETPTAPAQKSTVVTETPVPPGRPTDIVVNDSPRAIIETPVERISPEVKPATPIVDAAPPAPTKTLSETVKDWYTTTSEKISNTFTDIRDNITSRFKSEVAEVPPATPASNIVRETVVPEGRPTDTVVRDSPRSIIEAPAERISPEAKPPAPEITPTPDAATAPPVADNRNFIQRGWDYFFGKNETPTVTTPPKLAEATPVPEPPVATSPKAAEMTSPVAPEAAPLSRQQLEVLTGQKFTDAEFQRLVSKTDNTSGVMAREQLEVLMGRKLTDAEAIEYGFTQPPRATAGPTGPRIAPAENPTLGETPAGFKSPWASDKWSTGSKVAVVTGLGTLGGAFVWGITHLPTPLDETPSPPPSGPTPPPSGGTPSPVAPAAVPDKTPAVIPPTDTRRPCGPNDTYASSGCYPPYRAREVPPPNQQIYAPAIQNPNGPVLDRDYYCITSIQPVVVIPLSAGSRFPSNCYNSYAGNPNNNPFAALGQMLGRVFGTPAPAPAPAGPTRPLPPVVPPTATSTPAKPIAALIANPATVALGGKSRLTWSSINTSSCELFAPDSISMATGTRGSTSTAPLATTTKFILTCSASSGATTSAQTTVRVR